ncbi:Rrf2 family transcriptional regulator, cysteine metabolism repressor [Nitratiruptor sp. YY08-26]|uniref:Rrf2 family transcriptional regulator n=1 Tax=unclassified Nitratiruptor TaxID=2624044 RepID=UPI001915E389|nr:MULTISPECIES: Rrf2 family transcriptional regulator [unclassified Nitratiruptor]BCD61229.1 Rrf2 family transcriptional regulator, cysteine metabolism repressor [Nitratiruptor sp. YY08-13]BCD65162.1 Rrf2 family transcriptional regulator, cysteine metabolism repressor [Nitratiruptor sp. YY08-26]
MPKITTKSVYALAAVYFLYSHMHKLPMKIESIAEGAHIPKNFLEQLLLLLKKSGILKSIRGARGGYTFAKDVQEILFLDIVKAVESECCNDVCKTHNPVLNLFWKDLGACIQDFLQRPISDLDTYIKKTQEASMFII